jgi:hypothetical protein
LVCSAAESQCEHGSECAYAKSAAGLFERNAGVLSKEALAVAVRNVIINGPSKTTRVPLLVGPTNTGKSTLLLPVDKLFGFACVFHKPVLGSKFALRNLLKNKRFIFWDDYRPTEYAAETVPTTTFLSLFQGQPFEVAVSQSFSDGNVDFEWRRGALMTAKEQGLWKVMAPVTQEDVLHMQSRVEVFRCTAQVAKLKTTDACPCCMAKWICAGATAHDARVTLHQVSSTAGVGQVEHGPQPSSTSAWAASKSS